MLYAGRRFGKDAEDQLGYAVHKGSYCLRPYRIVHYKCTSVRSSENAYNEPRSPANCVSSRKSSAIEHPDPLATYGFRTTRRIKSADLIGKTAETTEQIVSCSPIEPRRSSSV